MTEIKEKIPSKKIEMRGFVKLSKFGSVETCKLVNEDVAIICVTTGFSESASKTFEFMKDCQLLFPNHTVIETFITRKDFALVVLKSEAKQ